MKNGLEKKQRKKLTNFLEVNENGKHNTTKPLGHNENSSMREINSIKCLHLQKRKSQRSQISDLMMQLKKLEKQE